MRKLTLYSMVILLVVIFSNIYVWGSTDTGEKVIDVTVPTSIPLYQKSNGDIIGNTINIANNSSLPIKIESINVIANNEWRLIRGDTDIKSELIDSKKFGISIEQVPNDENGNIPITGHLNNIAGGENLSLKFDAVITPSTSEGRDIEIADVVFVVKWKTTPDLLEYEVDGENGLLLTKDKNTDEVIGTEEIPVIKNGPIGWGVDMLTEIYFVDSGVVDPKNYLINKLDIKESNISNYSYIENQKKQVWAGTKSSSKYGWGQSLYVVSQGNTYLSSGDRFLSMRQDLLELDLENLNTTGVTNMDRFFNSITSIIKINYGHNFDTSMVTSMSEIFSCFAVDMKEIDFSYLDTRKVTNARGMFYDMGKYDLEVFKIGKNFYSKNFNQDTKNIFSKFASLEKFIFDGTIEEFKNSFSFIIDNPDTNNFNKASFNNIEGIICSDGVYPLS